MRFRKLKGDWKMRLRRKFQPYKPHPCNMCGLDCRLTPDWWYHEPKYMGNGLPMATVAGGYDSTPGNGLGTLDDGMRCTFSLCEFCLDRLFAKFKVPPAVSDYIHGNDPEHWMPAEQRVQRDDWRGMKAEFFAEQARRDEARGWK